jgi:hypothetical protein
MSTKIHPILGLILGPHQGRSTTPMEPPPTTYKLEKWGGLYKDVSVYGIRREHGEKEILLWTAPEVWLSGWALRLKPSLGVGHVSS